MRGPPCPQTLWSGQVYLLLMFCDTSTNICPLLCQQKGLQHPQASGCARAAHTHTAPCQARHSSLKHPKIWEKAAQVVLPGPQRSLCSQPPWLPLHTPLLQSDAAQSSVGLG